MRTWLFGLSVLNPWFEWSVSVQRPRKVFAAPPFLHCLWRDKHVPNCSLTTTFHCLKLVWLWEPGCRASWPSPLLLPLTGTTRLMKSLRSSVLDDNRWVMAPRAKLHDIRKVISGEQRRGVISCFKGLSVTVFPFSAPKLVQRDLVGTSHL